MPDECNIRRVDRYRLAPLRDARHRDERARRGALAAAVDDARTAADGVAGAERRVAAARTAVDAAVGARAELLARGVSQALLALADRYVQRRRRDLDAAVGEHLRARAAHEGRLTAVDEARGRLALARADREVIERHFAGWREQQQKLAERRED